VANREDWIKSRRCMIFNLEVMFKDKKILTFVT